MVLPAYCTQPTCHCQAARGIPGKPGGGLASCAGSRMRVHRAFRLLWFQPVHSRSFHWVAGVGDGKRLPALAVFRLGASRVFQLEFSRIFRLEPNCTFPGSGPRPLEGEGKRKSAPLPGGNSAHWGFDGSWLLWVRRHSLRLSFRQEGGTRAGRESARFASRPVPHEFPVPGPARPAGCGARAAASASFRPTRSGFA